MKQTLTCGLEFGTIANKRHVTKSEMGVCNKNNQSDTGPIQTISFGLQCLLVCNCARNNGYHSGRRPRANYATCCRQTELTKFVIHHAGMHLAAGYENFLRMMFVSVHWCRTAAGADLQGLARFWHVLCSSHDFMTCRCKKLLFVCRIR